MAVIRGLDDLSKKLAALGAKAGGKALRTSARNAMKPIQRMAKAAAPVGKKPHRTYKGNIVFPGYTKKAIRIRTGLKRGKATVRLGVLREAFYGVSFLDEGVTVKNRRTKKGNRLKKSYRIKGRHWFMDKFLQNRSLIEKTLRDELRKRLL